MDCFACARNDDLVRFSEVTLLDITRLVVPAKAGTHNHRRLLRWKVSATAPKTRGRGVWVPAFAGTTLRGRRSASTAVAPPPPPRRASARSPPPARDD